MPSTVISNADGAIEHVLSRCGIAGCFESITDSGIVGVEKPRPEIFEAALATMRARAHESLYVGDVYSVDYLGARNAGMQAVLFDVAGAYCPAWNRCSNSKSGSGNGPVGSLCSSSRPSRPFFANFAVKGFRFLSQTGIPLFSTTKFSAL